MIGTRRFKFQWVKITLIPTQLDPNNLISKSPNTKLWTPGPQRHSPIGLNRQPQPTMKSLKADPLAVEANKN